MNKFINSFLIAAATLALLSFQVFAQYDSDGFDGVPSEGGEIFGINVEGGESATIFPSGCDFIESITIRVKTDVRGAIELASHNKTNPVKEDKGLSGKILEHCEMKLQGFSQDDIESSIVRTKANKDLLNREKVENEDIRLFQYDESKKRWEQLDTPKRSESSVNYFYETDSVNKFRYLAFGEKTSGFNLNYLPFIICGFLLLLVIIVMIIAATTTRRRDEETE